MKPTRRKPIILPGPQAPVAPPRPDIHPREPWLPGLQTRSSFDGCRPHLASMRKLLHDAIYHLPPWQRGQVWTPAQQVAFCETIWNGLPFAPILLWERRVGKDHAVIILDGQQRLSALGANVLRHDGTPNEPTAAHLDLETGRWQIGPADGHPPITMKAAADMWWTWKLRPSMTEDGHYRLAMLVGAASTRLQHSDTSVYVIGASTPVEDAVRIFRAWNVPGTLFPPEEVERLIAEADLGWAPAIEAVP
jgi:hypothetical protein